MKTENTLRTARNSLLCIFTALAASFLVACGSDGGGGFGAGGGGGGGGGDPFSAYLVDAPVEGAEYSGPTNLVKDTTRKDGEFEASEGVFEFSVGATTLGSVQLDSNWANSQVTPFDFIGVDRAEAITIARIVQGLDYDGDPQNGISISRSTREGLLTVDLFALLTNEGGTENTNSIDFSVNSNLTLTIPERGAAEAHLVATRRCLYSGGYAGSYRQTAPSDSSSLDEGILAFVVEPFASQIRGVYLSDVEGEDRGTVGITDSDLADISIGSAITLTALTAGNELTFVSSRLATGIWSQEIGGVTESGTYEITLVAGDPSANRRIVGVETNTVGSTVTGLYVLDYFASGTNSYFSGQYYDVEDDEVSTTARLTVAGAATLWLTAETTSLALTLSGTSGDNTPVAVTVDVVRDSAGDNYGTFSGSDANNADSRLSGTWCDLRTPMMVSVVSGGALVESLAMSHSRIGGDVSAHRLSRYLDSGFPANTAIESVQILG